MAVTKSASAGVGAADKSRPAKAPKIAGTHLRDGFSPIYSVSEQNILDTLYIKDDSTIANYWSVPIERVRAVRAKEQKERPGRRYDGIQFTRQFGGVAIQEAADIRSTRELLKALIRYGIKHDGLPGLTAALFRQRAASVGILL